MKPPSELLSLIIELVIGIIGIKTNTIHFVFPITSIIVIGFILSIELKRKNT
jgi:hypothetical protein